MTSRLIPANPSTSMVIRDITPNIITCSAPFNRFGYLKVGGRGTIVRLQSGALAVFSPTALTPEVRTKVESLGNRVSYITAPDYEHHIFVSEWAKAYPSAKVLGVEGLPEKREANKDTAGTKFNHIWTQAEKHAVRVDEDFDREFDYEYVHSHANKELVFYHKPDRTLIEADLMFNLPATEQYSRTREGATSGFLTNMFVGLMTAHGEAKWQKRLLWYGVSSGDRKGFNESVRRIEEWDFDRIIPCHGDVIEKGGKGIFQNIFEWHLKGGHSK